MYQLKKIDIGTVALYSFLMFLILGLIIFLPMGFIMTIISSFLPETGELQTELFPLFGGILFILIPVLYAVFGTIVNIIVVLCYNLLSIKLGGIKIRLDKVGQLEPLAEKE